MSTRMLASAVVAVGFAVLAACGGSSNKTPASPSQTVKIDSFVGGWTSTPGTTNPASSCTKLNYDIKKTGDSSATVTYDVTCGGYDIVGTGTGALSGTTLTWNAAGTVSGNGLSCSFQFTDSTATLQGTDAILVTYNVTVCGVKISGSQVLHRKL